MKLAKLFDINSKKI